MKRFFDKSQGLYLGENEINRPTYLGHLSRSMHTQIIGATGVGKTESGILPMIFDDARNGYAIIFIDPKGDSQTRHTMQRICDVLGRTKDFQCIDLAQIEGSCGYNPLKVGSPTELKDKIIGSIIWTEEFYKKVSERILLSCFDHLHHSNLKPSLQVITKLLERSPKQDKYSTSPEHIRIENERAVLNQEISANRDNLEGLLSDLQLWTKSELKKVIDDPSGVSALDWITENKIVYINLNTLAFEETARRVGRLILQDVKTAVQRLQAKALESRIQTSLYIDEFASVASSGFIELLSKARSANVKLTLAHQSLGDLTVVSPSFANQILDNTNVKIIFRLDSPDTSDFFARLVGTRKIEKRTYQINSGLFMGKNETGVGSARMSDEFIVSPNQFRLLGRGESIVISKIPYSVSKCRMNTAATWIKNYENLEHKRRISWPKFSKIMLR